MDRSTASAVLSGFMVSALVSSAALASEADKSRFTTAPPSGFEQLEAERELVVDVFYGGTKRGTARVAVFGDRLEFMDARQAVSFIDDASPQTDLLPLFRIPLEANRSLACGLSAPSRCGLLDAETVGVVLDEDRFRLDIFVSEKLRTRQSLAAEDFLAKAPDSFSLVSLFGTTLAGGTTGEEFQYRLQNRTIAAFGANRLRSDLSLQRGRRLSFDNLVAEADRGDWRFSAGQFWIPGTDLVARRKAIGAGVSSQFDTRRNKEQFYGTPVEIFLRSPARVEVYVDDRLIASQVLSAGNRLLDTSNWPSGSYDAVIRVSEQGQAIREERRFFSRDEALAPLGHATYQIFGGIYSSDGDFDSSATFVQGAVGYRFTRKIGARAMAVAVRDKVIVDVSGTYVAPAAQFTLGALTSSKGDVGVVFRGYTTALKGVSASFDLRKMHTSGNGPLLPESRRAGTYDRGTSGAYDQGDFLQLTGQLSARVAEATVRFSGYFRHSPSSANSYSFGPSADMPILKGNRFSIVAEGDAHKTDAGFNGYAGIRLLLTDGPRSLALRGGVDSGQGYPARLRGEVQGATFGESGATHWSANAAIGKSESSTYARAGGELRSERVNARGEILHDFGNGAQYSLTAETGFVLAPGAAIVAGGTVRDAALVVTADGKDAAALDIFVNDAKAGTTKTGQPLVIYLEPYREYDVKARPHDADLLSADFSVRRIAAYPGSVVRTSWEVARMFVAFGRLVGSDGDPIANARITGPHGVAATDENGYFQIEVASGEALITEFNGSSCGMVAPSHPPSKSYLKWGDVRCR